MPVRKSTRFLSPKSADIVKHGSSTFAGAFVEKVKFTRVRVVEDVAEHFAKYRVHSTVVDVNEASVMRNASSNHMMLTRKNPRAQCAV